MSKFTLKLKLGVMKTPLQIKLSVVNIDWLLAKTIHQGLHPRWVLRARRRSSPYLYNVILNQSKDKTYRYKVLRGECWGYT